MDYSDKNLYQLFIALSHQLARTRGFGKQAFPPRGHSDAPFLREPPTFAENMPPSGIFPDTRKGFPPDSRRPHPQGDHRPPLARERILRLIGETEPVSQIKLAELLSIRPQSLSEQLAKLEKEGLILRVPSAQDKRVTLVSLTEQGKQRALEVEAARAEQSAAFLAPLSPEERKQLFLLLQKLLERG